MTLWVKVCGLRTLDAVEAAVDAGADAVGFVFHAGSPRSLEPDAARVLAANVPHGVARVVVFRHPSQSMLDAAIAAVKPDFIQTDAQDFDTLTVPAQCARLPVYRSGGTTRATMRGRLLYEGAQSGAGERADWIEAARLASAADLVLAGGLDVHNVADAVRTVRPFGVDVSSGVERARGEKDPALIREFVRAARMADAALASGVRLS